MAAPSSPAVGLVFPGDTNDPEKQSGRPYHLGRALEELGCRVLRLSATLPATTERLLLGVGRRTIGDEHANLGPELAWLRSRALGRRARSLDPGVPLILVGTAQAPPRGRRFVTYDDMTVVQALADYPDWQALPGYAAAGRRRLQARLYAGAAGCCVTSGWTGRSVVEDYGVDSARVHVVGLGTNAIAAPSRRDWSVPRFLFVGRAWERKNGDAVVRAFAHVRREHPEATLDLVGEHPPQSGAGVRDHGHLALGDPEARRELARLYRRATCFVVPSRHEPTGIVFAEAASAGLPMIGSTRGGTADVIGPAGALVDPEDDAQLVRAMLDLAEPERARTLGEAARARAELFTWGAVARRFVGILGLAEALGVTPVAPLPLGPA